MVKKTVHLAASEKLRAQLDSLRMQLNEISEAIAGDTKSSAGDKHETSRAMAQIEQERIGKQLQEGIKQYELLERLTADQKYTTVQIGCLVATTQGWFYLSVPLGKLLVEKLEVTCISSSAPFARAILGKKEGERISWQEKDLVILEIK